jgi:hypothetical protein
LRIVRQGIQTYIGLGKDAEQNTVLEHIRVGPLGGELAQLGDVQRRRTRISSHDAALLSHVVLNSQRKVESAPTVVLEAGLAYSHDELDQYTF